MSPQLLVAECLHVRDVLRSPGRTLVLDQRATPDHRYLAAFEGEAFTIRNGFGKGDAVGAIDDVDPPRWNAELEDAVVGSEVLDAYFEG